MITVYGAKGFSILFNNGYCVKFSIGLVRCNDTLEMIQNLLKTECYVGEVRIERHFADGLKDITSDYVKREKELITAERLVEILSSVKNLQ